MLVIFLPHITSSHVTTLSLTFYQWSTPTHDHPTFFPTPITCPTLTPPFLGYFISFITFPCHPSFPHSSPSSPLSFHVVISLPHTAPIISLYIHFISLHSVHALPISHNILPSPSAY